MMGELEPFDAAYRHLLSGETDDAFPLEEREANARLIAAAPDLLAALTWLLDDMEAAGEARNAKGQDYDSVAFARAALRKAAAGREG